MAFRSVAMATPGAPSRTVAVSTVAWPMLSRAIQEGVRESDETRLEHDSRGLRIHWISGPTISNSS
jgi:hypothetical protein